MKKVAKVLSLIVVAIFMIMLVGCDNDMAKTNTATDIQDLEFEIKLEDLDNTIKNSEMIWKHLIPNDSTYEGEKGNYKWENNYKDYWENEIEYSINTVNYNFTQKKAVLTYTSSSLEEKIFTYENAKYWILISSEKLTSLVTNIEGTEYSTILIKDESRYYSSFKKGKYYECPQFNVIILEEIENLEIKIATIILSKDYCQDFEMIINQSLEN